MDKKADYDAKLRKLVIEKIQTKHVMVEKKLNNLLRKVSQVSEKDSTFFFSV